MSTKKELEKINGDLRQKVLDLKEDLAKYKKVDIDNIDSEFDQIGLGIQKVGEEYKIIELRYNYDLGNGVVFAEHESGPNTRSKPLLQQNSIKFLLENIVDLIL